MGQDMSSERASSRIGASAQNNGCVMSEIHPRRSFDRQGGLHQLHLSQRVTTIGARAINGVDLS